MGATAGAAMKSTTVRFVDTNVLLYAVSTDQGDRSKTEVAREILRARDLVLSVQVLQEFYVQATRASRPDPLTHDQATSLITSFARFPVQDLTMPVVIDALATKNRYEISYWDAAIVAAARARGCGVLLSEDLSNGQDYGDVRVVNPFEAA